MARQQSISDKEIIEAARHLFIENGLQTTTAEIAEYAGISEGTIYQRFDTKTDLFMASMNIPRYPGWIETMESIEPDGDLREDLIVLSDEVIEFFKDIVPKINMVMSSKFGDEPLFESENEAPPARGLKPTIQFFHGEQKRGRIAVSDPEIVARMYLGSLFHFAFAEVSGLNDIFPMPKKTYVRSVVGLLMQGILPRRQNIEI